MMDSIAEKFSLAGRTALVTGASSGLGYRFARVLAEAGAKVACAARRTDRLEKLVGEIRAAGGHAAAIALDVTRTAEIEPALDWAEETLGPISVLVNNAGLNIAKPLVEYQEAEYDSILGTDLKAVFFVAQAVARRLMAHNLSGSIVNISSLAGLRPVKRLGLYAAAKAGVAQLTRAMALEWAAANINVNAILPGYIETELNTQFLRSTPGEAMIQTMVRKRVMEPEALDGVLLLLASPASRYTTGSLYLVDDGQGFTLN